MVLGAKGYYLMEYETPEKRPADFCWTNGIVPKKLDMPVYAETP